MRRALVLFVAAAGLACTEQLDNDVGCPILCPQAPLSIQTTVLEPVVLDTTINALVAVASEQFMLLSTRGDTSETRVVVRYDSLPRRFRPSLTDTTTQPIAVVRNSTLRLRIVKDEAKIPDPTTIELYDVDTTAADTNFAALLPLFRANRRIGGGTFPAAQFTDSVRVPVSDSAVLATVQAGRRLRIGIRATAGSSVQFYVLSSEQGNPPRLSFRPSTDTTVALIQSDPLSRTPAEPAELQANLRDFQITARAPPRGPRTLLNVGGLPASRAYLRFDIPASILDSTTVVRATLLLTQTPNRAFPRADTMGIAINLVLAGPVVTDITRAATLLGNPDFTGVGVLRVAPADSGERSIDIATFLRFWRGVDRTQIIPAIVLTSLRENGSPLEARFFSREAIASLRPRLRISYAPNPPVGLP